MGYEITRLPNPEFLKTHVYVYHSFLVAFFFLEKHLIADEDTGS